MAKVNKEIVEETDPDTGEPVTKEYLSIDETYKDYNDKSNPPKPVDPQIAIEKEPPAAQRKDPLPSATELEEQIDTNDTPIPLERKEVQPEEVVYDQSGAVKYDGKKPRPDLIPAEVIFAMGHLFGYGANKYSDRNWEKGMDWGRVYGALNRHLWSWWSGEDKDPESKKSHLWHAACCLSMLVAYEQRGTGTDTRPIKQQEGVPDK